MAGDKQGQGLSVVRACLPQGPCHGEASHTHPLQRLLDVRGRGTLRRGPQGVDSRKVLLRDGGRRGGATTGRGGVGEGGVGDLSHPGSVAGSEHHRTTLK
jgi:hypothetical protein